MDHNKKRKRAKGKPRPKNNNKKLDGTQSIPKGEKESKTNHSGAVNSPNKKHPPSEPSPQKRIAVLTSNTNVALAPVSLAAADSKFDHDAWTKETLALLKSFEELLLQSQIDELESNAVCSSLEGILLKGFNDLKLVHDHFCQSQPDTPLQQLWLSITEALSGQLCRQHCHQSNYPNIHRIYCLLLILNHHRDATVDRALHEIFNYARPSDINNAYEALFSMVLPCPILAAAMAFNAEREALQNPTIRHEAIPVMHTYNVSNLLLSTWSVFETVVKKETSAKSILEAIPIILQRMTNDGKDWGSFLMAYRLVRNSAIHNGFGVFDIKDVKATEGSEVVWRGINFRFKTQMANYFSDEFVLLFILYIAHLNKELSHTCRKSDLVSLTEKKDS